MSPVQKSTLGGTTPKPAAAKPGAPQPGAAKPQPAAARPIAKGNNPPRFLGIAGSEVSKTPVHITAMYSGDVGDGVFNEFRRRYGYSDYVVLQTKDQAGGTVGRVYAWNGDSAGVNKPLQGVPSGARGQIQDASGKVLFEGEVVVKHDFEQAVARKEIRSADGRFTAKLCEAGFPGLNVMLVTDAASGKETRWQAGSRSGDLYLNAQFVGGTLIAYEGKPDDQLVFQLHDRERFISEVLGPDQLVQDALAAGLDLDPARNPRVVASRPGRDTLQYTGEFALADGSRVRKTFEGRFQLDEGGFMRLVDRRPAENPN